MDTSKKELVIKLIQQDLKHNQLTMGLQKIGLNIDTHHLELIEVVMELMHKNKTHVSLRLFFNLVKPL